MGKKIGIAAVVLVLAGAGWYAWTILRFTVIFRMKVQNEILPKQLGRFPTPQQLIDLPQLVNDAARESHVPTEGLLVTQQIEGRVMGPVTFWFDIIHIQDAAGRSIDVEHRFENKDTVLNDAENLEQHGIKIKGR